jgi:hypothetical protein
MFVFFKKRKVEKVFNKLCAITQMNYGEFNHKIELSREQIDKINNDDLNKNKSRQL